MAGISGYGKVPFKKTKPVNTEALKKTNNEEEIEKEIKFQAGNKKTVVYAVSSKAALKSTGENGAPGAAAAPLHSNANAASEACGSCSTSLSGGLTPDEALERLCEIIIQIKDALLASISYNDAVATLKKFNEDTETYGRFIELQEKIVANRKAKMLEAIKNTPNYYELARQYNEIISNKDYGFTQEFLRQLISYY